MEPRKLATILAWNRVAFGIGFMLRPERSARSWIGRRVGREPGAQLFARAVGARDLGLGLGALLALREGDEESARRWFAAHAVSDGTDFLATWAARPALPAPAAAFALLVAGGSAAVAAYAARSLGGSG